MNKKILFGGSIAAAIIIVLVSFTSVVGFQSVKMPSKVADSPLFSIRTQRAIQKESKDIFSCEYLGKDKQAIISFPKRDNRMVLIQKIIDTIKGMDSNEYSKFINLFVKRAHEENIVTKYHVSEIIHILYQIKKTPQILNYMGDNRNDETYYDCTTGLICHIFGWFFFLFIIFSQLYYIFFTIIHGC